MVRHIQPNFSGGELTEALSARVDLVEYNQSVKVMKNMICHIQGGFSNRAGTAYLANFADTPHRFIKFQFSVEQAYALVFTNLKMFVLKDGEIVESGGSPVEFVTPWPTAALDTLSFTQSVDVLFIVHPDYPEYEIARTSHTVWTVTEVEYVEDPYDERTLANEDDTLVAGNYIGSSQSIDASADTFVAGMVGRTLRVGYVNQINPSVLVWGAYRINSIVNTKEVSGSVIDYLGVLYTNDWDFNNGISYWYLYSDDTQSEVSWSQADGEMILLSTGVACEVRTIVEVAAFKTYTLRIDLSNTTMACGLTIKVGTTLGASDLLSYTLTSLSPYATDLTVENNTTLYVSLVNTLTACQVDINSFGIWGDISATQDWRVPAFRGAGYYPGVVSFFEQRKVLGGSDELPQTLWHSKTGGYYDFGFSTPIVDDDSIMYTLAGAGADGIKWVAPVGEMVVGTSDGLWKVSRGSQSGAMTPLSIDAKKKYRVGCAKKEPIVLGKSIFFIERGANSVEQVVYSTSDSDDEFQGFSITDQAVHLFKGKTIVDWTYARDPDPIIYCILSDGTMAALTVDLPRQIYGWHRHETDGNYKNVVAVPGDTREDVYFVVERTINSSTKYYVEHLQPRITDEDTGDWWFVDSGLRYSGSPATTISGLDHLEGETVKVLADGGVQTDKTVASGEITLDNEASLVIAGLGYDQELETLDLDLADQEGNTVGLVKNVSKITFKVVDTRGFEAGTDENNLEAPRVTTQAQGEGAIPFISGTMELLIDSGFEDELSIFVKNSDPVPLTVLSIIPEIRTIEDESQVQ